MEEKIKKEDEELILKIRDEWINHFENGEFDEEKAKKVIDWLYEKSGYKKPMKIIFDSPYALQIGANILEKIEKFTKSEDFKRAITEIKTKPENKKIEYIDPEEKDIIRKLKIDLVGNNKSMNIDVTRKIREEVYEKMSKNIDIFLKLKDIEKLEKETKRKISDNFINKFHLEEDFEDKVKNNKDVNVFCFGWYGDVNDYAWVAFYDFFERKGLMKGKDFDDFREYRDLIKANIFATIQLEDFCFISRPPVFLNRDEKGRMHSTHDYAMSFKDGYGVHYVHGVFFSEEDFKKYVAGKKATGKEIMKVRNSEQRSVLIKLYGYEYLLNDFDDLKEIEREEVTGVDGKKKRHILYSFNFDGNLFKFLSLDDHSTDKTYFEGVPPEIKTLNEAFCWRNELPNETKYKPSSES